MALVDGREERLARSGQMSGQKYLRTNFDDDDDQLVDSSAGAAASGVSPTDGTGGGLDGAGRPSPHVSVYTTTVAFGGVDSGPAVRRPATLLDISILWLHILTD